MYRKKKGVIIKIGPAVIVSVGNRFVNNYIDEQTMKVYKIGFG